MINRIHIEISVFSSEAAEKAEKAGADRIELCAGPSEDGTTPPFSMIKAVCNKVNIPVYPIIRLSGGNFFYSDEEWTATLKKCERCGKLPITPTINSIHKPTKIKSFNDLNTKKTEQHFCCPVTIISMYWLSKREPIPFIAFGWQIVQLIRHRRV
ncbi:MAG: copper homeostasis protein CutC, partial [Marinilabiliaceae bacterium]